MTIQTDGPALTGAALLDALWLFVHDEVIVHAPAEVADQVRDTLQAVMTTTFRGVAITAEAEILGTPWGALPDTEAVTA